jgi:TolB-like protein/Tfp pilus assembly protein PilF/tRNA A-37 threonylcarbamoyl transferase component Bud32
MTPERWQHIEEIFQTALDLAPEERERFITSACTGDDALQREVQTLLTQYEAAGDFIDEPLYEQSGVQVLASMITDEGDPMLGRLVGAYKIEREIGRGGMGAVYLATRADNVFQKLVAIKVVKRGMDTDFILRRFRRERQIVASLDHVNIARLLDGGATEDGRPYFVMEYIEGEPIYQFCDSRRLSVRDRLRLFCQVCDAVHYAHQNQVIHRDIKPSNILVNSGGTPKLFDFGIAKLLNPDIDADTAAQTATAMRLMTVEYASPEQVQGLPVTFLSDLYSLGVLLFEMLTGHRPYRFRNRMLHEMARVISEEEPEFPSVAVNRAESLLPVAHVDQEAMTIGHLCEMRSETPDSLRRELAGSLDNITLKSLRKQPEDRYQSAHALREDIERYLEGKPISAPIYVRSAEKRARAAREARSDEVSIAVLPFKLMGAAQQTGESDDEYLGVGLADALITRLSKVRRLVVRPTGSILPYGSRESDAFAAGNELGVGFVLDGYVQRAGDRLRVSVQLLNVQERTTVWAEAFHSNFTDVFSIQDTISTQVAEALVPRLSGFERRQLAKHGTDNPDAFEAYLRGRYFLNLVTPEGFEKAISHFEQAVALDPAYALAYSAMADCYFYMGALSGDPPSECAMASRRMSERALALDDVLGEAYTMLGYITYHHDHKPAEAERAMLHGLQLNPNYAAGHLWYSVPVVARGDFDLAISEAQRAVELDPASPFIQQHLGWILYHSRRFDEALAQVKNAVESAPDFNHSHGTYGWLLRHAGRFDEAIEVGRRAVELSNGTPWLVASLAASYAMAGRTSEANELLQKLEQIAAEDRYISPFNLALAYLHLGKHDRALALLEEAWETKDVWLAWLPTEPQLDPLRHDPRFKEIERRMNMHQARALRATTISINEERETAAKSVAILPFNVVGASPTGETGDDYLGVGLADALISRLSNVRRLVLRPTSSVLQHKKTDDPLEIGRNLSVDFVVEGNIRRVGDTLRVTVQLLSVEDAAARWAGKFDEKSTDVLLLEDLISEQIASALIPQLTGEEQLRLSKRGTNSAEAFDAYLRGRFHWNTPNEESSAKSIAFYNRAVALDPDYALAYAGIADYYNMLGVYGVMPFAEASSRAKDAAFKAVALDDTLAAGFAALGFATLMHDFDWEAAEEYLRRAVGLNPNYAVGRLWYGYYFALAGRKDEALQHARAAVELDPSTPMIQHSVNWVYYLLRRYDEAIGAARSTAANDPQYGLSFVFLCLVMMHTGRYAEAIEAGHKAVELLGRTPYMLTRLASAYAESGQREQAIALLGEIMGMSATRYVSPNMIATVHLHLGDYDSALAELERALEIRDARIVWLGVDPQFDVLRGNPRFIKLLKSTNNPAPQPVDVPDAVVSQSGNRGSAFRAAGEPRTGEKSVAVLPFKMIGANKSPETGDEYLGIGLADALITRLSNVQRFIVRPTSSVLQYAESAETLNAGHELAVDFIIDGTIRRIGDTLRVSAQLFSTSDGATRWSERFDKKSADVLQLEDTLSAHIANALIPQLTGEEQQRLAKRGTDNPQAFEAYLRGRYHWHSLTEAGFAKAIQSYQRAIELDPNYALAYAAISDYYNFLGIYCIVPFAESSLASKQAAERAVELDDTLAEAHASLAFALVSYERNWSRAEELYRRALELNPNSSVAHNWYGFMLLQSGRLEESLAEITRTQQLDPVTPLVSQSIAWCHYHSRRFDASVSIHEQLVESEPEFAWGRLTFSWALICAGRKVEAVDQARQANALGGESSLYLSGLGIALAAAGMNEEARQVVARLKEASLTRYVSPYFLGLIYCHLGDTEQALAHLAETIAIGDAWDTWLAVEPQFDPLRTDPRFDELVRRTHNPALKSRERESAKRIERVDSNNEEHSIAVLPFKLFNVMSAGDTDDKYLSIGLADALITRLSNVRRINVRPTSSIAHFSQEDSNPLDAGRLLNVRHVLEGRIQRAGERIRVTVQLINIPNNKPVWAGQFHENFTDVLSIQDSISEQVAHVLVPQLTGHERKQLAKRETDDAAAFEAYMRGRYYWNTFTMEGFAKALLCYNRAVAFAPDYALAYTGIADYYTFLGVYAVLPFSETSAAAKEAALKAVALDNDLAEAYSSLGMATLLHDFDWKTTERHLNRAIELNPNFAIGRSWYSYFLGMTGRFDEAFEQVQRAMEIDPLTPIIHHTLNWNYYYGRRYEESAASIERLIASEPQYGLAYVLLCPVLSKIGRHEEAIAAGLRGVEMIGRSPYTLSWLAAAYAAAGQTENARALVSEIEQMYETRYVSPYLLAMVYCNLGENEQAIASLERAWAIRDGRLAWMGVDPQLDPLREDPRFARILALTNNPSIESSTKAEIPVGVETQTF